MNIKVSSLICVFVVVMSLFGEQPMHSQVSLDSFAVKTGSPCPTGGNGVEIVTDPRAAYQELLASIRSARKHILMEYYIFRKDSISTVILEALASKAEEGVRSYVIMDYFGCAQHLEEQGKHLRFTPLKKKFLRPYLDRGVKIAFYHKSLCFPHDHRKLTLVDDEVAFTGGMNISNLYFKGNLDMGEFHDVVVKIQGPVVGYFRKAFEHIWDKCSDSPLRLEALALNEPCGDVPVMVLETKGRSISPTPEALYTTLFEMAEHNIRFVAPYFLPTRRIKKSIEAAIRRGVKVEMLIGSSSDMPWGFDKVMMNLAIHLSKEDNFTLYVQPDSFHHEKVVCVDEHLIVVGSHNLDRISLRHNEEMSAMMDSPELCSKFKEYFFAKAQYEYR